VFPLAYHHLQKGQKCLSLNKRNRPQIAVRGIRGLYKGLPDRAHPLDDNQIRLGEKSEGNFR